MIITADLAYTLGACFDVEILEKHYRKTVVDSFDKFLANSSECFNMLSKWCPNKLQALVRDGMTNRLDVEKGLIAKHTNEKSAWEQERSLMDCLIVQHCKEVKASSCTR